MIEQGSVVVAMHEMELSLIIDRDVKETTGGLFVKVGLLDLALGVGGLGTTGFFTLDGIFIIEGTDGELLNAERMDAVILPVTISTKGEHVFDSLVL